MEVTNHFDFRTIVVERGQNATLLVRVKAPPSPEAASRNPLNLSLVLDRSGSMSGEKLHHVQLAASQVIDHLAAKDTISVVFFDHEVETVVPAQSVKDKQGIKNLIHQTFARGLTNLSGGWLEGLSRVESKASERAINRVLLLTDGQANQGVSDPAGLCAIGAEYREKGVSTTALGFGADFNEDLLLAIADASGGAFYFIENPDKAPEAFKEELGELLSVVGQNLVVEFRRKVPVRAISVLNRYPMELTENGVRILVGDLFGEEEREILAQMWIPEIAELGPCHVGDMVVTVDQVIEPIKRHHIELPVELTVVRQEEAQTEPDPEVEEPASLLRVGSIRDKVTELLKQEEFDEARRFVERALAEIEAKGTPSENLAREIQRIRSDVSHAFENRAMGSKGMFYGSYRLRRGKGEYKK